MPLTQYTWIVLSSRRWIVVHILALSTHDWQAMTTFNNLCFKNVFKDFAKTKKGKNEDSIERFVLVLPTTWSFYDEHLKVI